MYRKTSKLRKRAELSLIYTIMIIAVIGVVAVLILIMQGYRFNRYDGKIEQGGLLQYDSQPDGGTVYINNTRLANQTPNKITVSSGNHTIRMTKDGYEDWEKKVTVAPGGILWLNYTRFILKERKPEQVLKFSEISDVLISRDKKRALLKESPQTPEIAYINLDTNKPEKVYIQLLPELYTKAEDPASVTYDLVSWDRDNRYALIKYAYDGKVEWLVIDTRDKTIAHNVTKELGVDIKTVAFSYSSSKVLYTLTMSNELRRIELSEKILSGPLISNVQEFTQFDRSTIVFTTLIDSISKKRSVGYLTNGADVPRLVRSYADDGTATLQMRIGHYYNKNYIAVAYGDSVEIMTGDLPSSGNMNPTALKVVNTVTVPDGIQYIGFSPDENRHFYAQNSSQIVTYDLELNKMSTIGLGEALNQEVRWVDRYHFVTTVQGKVRLFEFDGANDTVIAENSLNFPAEFSPSDKYMYVFSLDDGSPSLSRVRIER